MNRVLEVFRDMFGFIIIELHSLVKYKNMISDVGNARLFMFN